MLPALTAVLAGALVAGAATVLTDVGASSAEHTRLSLAATDTRTPDARGGLSRPISARPSSSAPAGPTSTTSAVPPTSSTAPSPPPAPPPPASSEPPSQPPPAAPAADTSQQEKVVSDVNAFRAERGCGPVQVDSRLTAAAQGHSSDMSNRGYFSHDTPEGVTFDQRIRNAGYPRPGAENIARGAQSAEDVMRMWMQSDGHRANILNCDLTAIGVGLDRNGWHWTQDFGY